MEDLGACVAGGGAGDVLLLIDESGSLTTSDPSLSRVTSATYFVEQLASYAETGGLDLNVQVSVFGHDYTTLLGWTALDSASLPVVRSTIDTLGSRVSGVDTDYWTALDGARRDLAGQVTSRGATTSCQAVVWFTDGELDYFVRSTDAQQEKYGAQKLFAPGTDLVSAGAATVVRDAAVSDLCRAGGLADQVRSSGIRLYGVGLNGSTSAEGDFAFFESLVTGHSSETSATCGELVEPVPGEFYLATDVDSMLFAFDAVGSPGAPPITQGTGICQVVRCTDQAHRFVLDASTPDVRILAAADIAGLETSLTLPDGQTVDLVLAGVGQRSSQDIGGITVEHTWQSDRTVSITLTPSAEVPPSWTGLWLLTFTDPSGTSADKGSRSNVHISSSLQPAWLNDDLELRTGEVVDGVELGLVDRADSVVDPATILGSLIYQAVLTDSAGESSTVFDTFDVGTVGDPLSLDLTDAAIGDATLTLSLAVTTAPVTLSSGAVEPGTTLEPAVVTVPVTILAPPSYPTLGASINFGQVTGAVAKDATLLVTGPGCAWISEEAATTIVASPEGLGDVRVLSPGATSEDTCVDAGTALPVRLTADEAGNGSLNGSIPVMIAAGDGAGEPIEVQVEFTASLEKPLDTTRFWVVLLVALVLGPGIPLVVLYGAKRAVARIPPRGLVGTVVDVAVTHEVTRAGMPFALGPEDLRHTVPISARGSRRLDIGYVQLRARVGRSPAGAGYIEVLAPGTTSASSARPSRTRRGNARLPLAVHDQWAVLHRPGTSPREASVLVLVGGDTPEGRRLEMEQDIRRRLPGLLEDLVPQGGPGPSSDAPSSPFAAGTARDTPANPWRTSQE